ncbi:kinase-like domain-containing protein [Pilobolus umbonatus]|nr:kinase-like domain-containing protein [Pilobolus umbonatus]
MGYPNRVPLTRFNRPLTHPDVPAMNRGYDNVHGDYIMRVNEIIGTKDKYKIIDMMGQGTFGQVAKCQKMSTGELFAIKVIKNKPAFYNQSLQEIRIISLMQLQYAHKHNNRILNMKDHFYFRNHTCIVFDLFYISYYHLLNSKMGTPRLVMKDIQLITHNLLQTLVTLRNINIIHADLKPDNILLKSKNNIHDAIIIDYGLALMKSDGMHCNVQTPYYRAPEVILKLAFDCSIDMWSFGCIVAELYLGRPLFPSVNENVLILMMVTMLK